MGDLSIPTLELSGGHSTRGRQYGEGAAEQIKNALAYYQDAFGESAGLTWTQVRDLASDWLRPSIDFAPDLVEEMEGIAEGASVDLLDVLALNARGEVIRLQKQRAGAESSDEAAGTESDLEAEGCSSFALLPDAAGDGHVYCGQNWDWRHQTLGTVLVLRIKQDGKPTIIQHVEAGQVGRQGANSAGIALNANGLGGRFPNGRAGVPQPLIRRRVLEQTTMNEALGVMIEARQDIASNALVTHRDGVAVDLETTPGAHGWLLPTDGLLVHGNHYQAGVPVQLQGSYRPYSVDSLYRVPIIERGMRGCRDIGDSVKIRHAIKGVMSDHFSFPESVCTHPTETDSELTQWSTLLSSCVDMTTGDYFVTAGTPCDHDYERVPWNLYDGPDA